MILGECTLALQAGRDWSAKHFSENLERFPRSCVMNSLARVNYGVFCGGQRASRLADIGYVWPVPCADDGLVYQRLRHLLRKEVERDFNQGGASSTVPKV